MRHSCQGRESRRLAAVVQVVSSVDPGGWHSVASRNCLPDETTSWIPELGGMDQACHRSESGAGTVVQLVDDHRCTRPTCTGPLDKSAGCRGLRTALGPVVHEECGVVAGEGVSHRQLMLIASVVRVGCDDVLRPREQRPVLANGVESRPEPVGDSGSEKEAARLHSHHGRDPSCSPRGGKSVDGSECLRVLEETPDVGVAIDPAEMAEYVCAGMVDDLGARLVDLVAQHAATVARWWT